MNTGTCDEDSLWNIKQMIYKVQCPSSYEVPVEDGGLLSSCKGKKDGNYANDISLGYRRDIRFGIICNAYYRCHGGVSTVVLCPNGTVFESMNRSCRHGNHSIELACQLYYNPNFRMYNFPNNFAECPYPEQFSDVT